MINLNEQPLIRRMEMHTAFTEKMCETALKSLELMNPKGADKTAVEVAKCNLENLMVLNAVFGECIYEIKTELEKIL